MRSVNCERLSRLGGELESNSCQIAADTGSRHVVVMRPDLSLVKLDCPAPGSIPEDVVAQMEAILPSATPRRVVVAASTDIALAMETVIPFFGILNGLAYIGHSVWIFDPLVSDIAERSRGADLLIIDGRLEHEISNASLSAARAVMRSDNVVVHDRESFRLRVIAAEPRVAGSWEDVIVRARAMTTSKDGSYRIALVQEDRTIRFLTCIPPHALTPERVAQTHQIVPKGRAVDIAVIAQTQLVTDASDSDAAPAVAQLRAAGRTIPFFGLLLNVASVGNRVCIFNGHPESVIPGCRGADFLFIDSVLSGAITARSVEVAAKVMRAENVLIYDRNSKKLGYLRKAE